MRTEVKRRHFRNGKGEEERYTVIEIQRERGHPSAAQFRHAVCSQEAVIVTAAQDLIRVVRISKLIRLMKQNSYDGERSGDGCGYKYGGGGGGELARRQGGRGVIE
jgi:hypothetical protein